MINICEVCKIEFESTKPAKTCSAKCRVTLARLRVTKDPNVTLAEPNVTHDVTFEFTVPYNRKPKDEGYDEDVVKQRTKVRTAIYWYDVPLAAVPVREKDWPEMPEWMNGRQYFLWWKNNFEVKDGQPVILNPFPIYDKVKVEMGGEGSRRWGA